MPVVYEPSLGLAVSGRKRVLVGDTSFIYDSAQFLVVSVDLPVSGMVVDASADDPYLCLKLDLDVGALAELLLAHDARVPHADQSQPGRSKARHRSVTCTRSSIGHYLEYILFGS